MSLLKLGYIYRGQILSVHDGDTLKVDIFLGIRTPHHDVELGFDLHISNHRLCLREDVRLMGCNARELDMIGGPETRDHLSGLLPVGTWVTVQTFKPDKFGGRYDAKVSLDLGGDVTSTMIKDCYALYWDGKGIKPVPPWPPVARM